MLRHESGEILGGIREHLGEMGIQCRLASSPQRHGHGLRAINQNACLWEVLLLWKFDADDELIAKMIIRLSGRPHAIMLYYVEGGNTEKAPLGSFLLADPDSLDMLTDKIRTMRKEA
jgi:hypothetical protein